MTARKKAKASAKKKRPVRTSKKKPSSPVKKKPAKKKPAKKAARKQAVKKAAKRSAAIRRGAREVGTIAKEPLLVEPGPPSGGTPPVEEPVPSEEAVGVVTHYYSDLGVAVVQVNTGSIRTSDRIRIKGHTTDLTQVVGSMEYEHQHVEQADAGQCVGIKVFDHAREHDIVYLVK